MRLNNLCIPLALAIVFIFGGACHLSLEDRIVGSYRSDWKDLKLEEKGSREAEAFVNLANHIMRNMRIELRADKTAAIHFMGLPIESKWKLSGSVLTISENPLQSGSSQPMVLLVSQDGKVLTEDSKSGNNPSMKFYRFEG